MTPTQAQPDIASPCIGICMLDADGLCRGCRRTLDEIANWTRMSDATRDHIMEEVLPLRDGVKP